MRYLLVNKAAGPRGVQTAAAGIVMVHPALPGSMNGVEAELTDEEVEMAETAGIELHEVQGSSITGLQSSDLPAEGQVNANTEEGSAALSKAFEDRAKAAARAERDAAKAAGKTAAPAPKPADATGVVQTGTPKTPEGSTTDASKTGDDKGGK